MVTVTVPSALRLASRGFTVAVSGESSLLFFQSLAIQLPNPLSLSRGARKKWGFTISNHSIASFMSASLPVFSDMGLKAVARRSLMANCSCFTSKPAFAHLVSLFSWMLTLSRTSAAGSNLTEGTVRSFISPFFITFPFSVMLNAIR